MAVSSLVAASGGVVRKQTSFTSSGTFTLPAGYGAGQPLIVDIEICGGGGGGGAGGADTATSCGGGTGGGSGVVAVYRNISLTANATITIGAGGAGGAAVSGTTAGNVGASGGTSNVDSTFYAPGGGGGSPGQSASPTTVKGLGVNSHGFYIPGGYSTGIDVAGAGGGSGSSGSANLNSGQTTWPIGGSRGSAGMTIQTPITGSTSLADVQFSLFILSAGKGLAAGNTSNPQGAITQTPVTLGGSNEILALQRGAGGAGARGNVVNVVGGGGAAGTRFNGGQSGYNDSTSVSGSKNGASASDAGCGGGGGGGIYASGGATTSGAGGAGAAGYCIITYWA